MAIELVAIDLDGTLLDAEHKVPHENAMAVDRLLRAGVTVSIASGRMHESTALYADLIGSDGPTISYNGAMVRTGSGETLFHQPLPKNVAAEVVRFCVNHDHHLNYYCCDRVYMREHTAWAEHYLAQTHSPMELKEDMMALLEIEPTKLILIEAPDEAEFLASMFCSHFEGQAYVTRTNPEYVELMHKDANKGSALARLAQHLGVPMSNTGAIGDALNDIPMLKAANLGIAMPAARREVCEAADVVCRDFPDAVERLLSIV